MPRRKRQKNKAKAADGSKPADEETEAGEGDAEQTNGDADVAIEPPISSKVEAEVGGEDEEML